jgi:predicted FMN-binding regulatory protein PaiB
MQSCGVFNMLANYKLSQNKEKSQKTNIAMISNGYTKLISEFEKKF